VGGIVCAGFPLPSLASMLTSFLPQGESRTERLVQRLQFPCWEPGHELPVTTLLPFLAAVSQCCYQGKSKKPGTLLSYSRCFWTNLTAPAWVMGQKDTVSPCPHLLCTLPCPQEYGWNLLPPSLDPAWLVDQVSWVLFKSLDPCLVSPCPWTLPPHHLQVPHPTLGQLQQRRDPAGHLPGHGAVAAAGRG
jgi:hypothetical protein